MLYADVSNGPTFRKQTFLLTLCAAEMVSEHPHPFPVLLLSATLRLNYGFSGKFTANTVISQTLLCLSFTVHQQQLLYSLGSSAFIF